MFGRTRRPPSRVLSEPKDRVDRAVAIGLLLCAVILPSRQLSAQVVIKESVAITDPSSSSKTLATNDTLTVNTDGTLMIEYISADMVNTALYGDAVLNIALNGSPFLDDTVAKHMDVPSTSTVICAPLTLWNRYQYSPPPDSAFVVGPVEEGDKITFDYHGHQTSSYYTTISGGSSWIGYQGSQSGESTCPSSPNTPLERINFTATVIPDTLNIKFDPPGDSDTYPEPGLEIEVMAIVTDAGDNGQVLFEIENFDYPDTENPDSLIYFLDGLDTTLTLDPVNVQNDTARATLIAVETWGQVSVTATWVPDVVSKSEAAPLTTQTKVKSWLDDSDHDGMPDDWEKKNGGLCMSNPNWETGDPGCDDADWDEETSNGNPNNGDGITKLSEYQGVMIGNSFRHLDPKRKEIFVDIHEKVGDATSLTTLLQGAAGSDQLDITLIFVEGVKSDFEFVNGDNQLEWRGSKSGSLSNYVRLMDAGLSAPSATGSDRFRNFVVIQDGVYVTGHTVYDADCFATSVCANLPKSADKVPRLGLTQWYAIQNGQVEDFFADSKTYQGTISNQYGANSIREDALHNFQWNIQDPSLDGPAGAKFVQWNAWFYESSLNDDSDTEDLINPFDILSAKGSPDDNDVPPDDVLWGYTELLAYYKTTLHEFGHAVGISQPAKSGLDASCHSGTLEAVAGDKPWDQSCHPKFGTSVMRSGSFLGGQANTFSDLDIKQMILTGVRQ